MLSIWEPVWERNRKTLGGTHWEIRGNGAELEFVSMVFGFVLCAVPAVANLLHFYLIDLDIFNRMKIKL